MTSSIRLRQALVVGLVLYGVVCLRSPEQFRLLDSVDLAVHETGHLVFAPLGEFLGFLGGSLFQVLFPLLFVVHFLRQGDRFAAYVVLWWVAQNLWNVSVYVADARTQALPLVGGGMHDWAYLLGSLGVLEQDQRLSRLVHLSGVLLFGWSMWMAFHAAGHRQTRMAARSPTAQPHADVLAETRSWMEVAVSTMRRRTPPPMSGSSPRCW